MAREKRDGNYPVSRDWADVDCRATGCKYNRLEKCMVSSRCKIGDDGRCTGFERGVLQIQKVNGD